MANMCDRCGKTTKEFIPLNAIPRNEKISVPFEIRKANYCDMKPCVLCADCVQSFFDWWKNGNSNSVEAESVTL